MGSKESNQIKQKYTNITKSALNETICILLFRGPVYAYTKISVRQMDRLSPESSQAANKNVVNLSKKKIALLIQGSLEFKPFAKNSK